MSQKGYIHLYGNCLYSKVKFPVDRSSYNTCSTIFPIVFNLLIVILSSFCRWIQALCLRKPAVRNKDIFTRTQFLQQSGDSVFIMKNDRRSHNFTVTRLSKEQMAPTRRKRHHEGKGWPKKLQFNGDLSETAAGESCEWT